MQQICSIFPSYYPISIRLTDQISWVTSAFMTTAIQYQYDVTLKAATTTTADAAYTYLYPNSLLICRLPQQVNKHFALGKFEQQLLKIGTT